MASWIQEGAFWPWLAGLLGLALVAVVLVFFVYHRRWTKEIKSEMGELKWLCQQAMDFAAWQERSKEWAGLAEPLDRGEEVLDLPRSGSTQAASGGAQAGENQARTSFPSLGERNGGRAFVWAAGFSRGPQGPACFGAVVKNSKGELLARMQKPVGRLDRRNAMYQGVAEALAKARQFGIEKVVVFTSPIGGPKGSRGAQNLPGIKEPIRKRLEEVRADFAQFEWIIVEPPKNREAEALAREGLLTGSRRKGESPGDK